MEEERAVRTVGVHRHHRPCLRLLPLQEESRGHYQSFRCGVLTVKSETVTVRAKKHHMKGGFDGTVCRILVFGCLSALNLCPCMVV